MIVAGLTGSIAMGKSTTAALFAERGIPVFDSDAAVHQLYAKGGAAVPAIASLAPEAVIDGAVDRPRLAARLLHEPALLQQLEANVHPLVRAMQEAFLELAKASGARLAILDIPLLYETHRDKDVDVVIVVTASEAQQRTRALERQGMNPEKLEFILSKQLPDREKRKRADFVVDTSIGFEDAARQVDSIISELAAKGSRESDT
jgi:dephospho-CoA kinase